MNEETKLYKNAGVEPINFAKQGAIDFTNTIEIDGKRYPDFTAEKQIAILQLLTQRCDLTISHFTEWEFIHYDGQEPLEITGKDFTETFAKLINAYWQDLTDAEHTQIKNILESEVRE